MRGSKTQYLYNKKQSVGFYEDRFEKGYMEEWPVEKKKKIFEVIQELDLPPIGEALDFGCGNGVLTDVIRQALPSWTIFGTDLSRKAIDNAKRRFPECIFFEADHADLRKKKFDFVFTNHVFEHVYDLVKVFGQMDEYLKSDSAMLHFLPCGNKGSYEYDICLLREDGINSELGNKFFFEDEGHVRRLTTEEFRNLCGTKGFELDKEFYSNQYYGAIDWITSSTLKFVLLFTDNSNAVDRNAKKKIRRVRCHLLSIALFRFPAQVFAHLLKEKKKQFKHYLLLCVGLPLFFFSIQFDKYWKAKSLKEWNTRKTEQNGSEMCLFFKRSS